MRIVAIDTAQAKLRRSVGDTASYVVNCNINYTNVCSAHCTFCAFNRNGMIFRSKSPDLVVE